MLTCFTHVTARRRGKTYPAFAALALVIPFALVASADLAQANDAQGKEVAAPPSSPPPPPFKLPSGTRWLPGEARYALTAGLADATRAIEKQLAKLGIDCQRIGPYRVRGVEVTRFLSRQSSTSWLAIHLIRKEGRTYLDVVARPGNGTP